jgi:hypothetical protein
MSGRRRIGLLGFWVLCLLPGCGRREFAAVEGTVTLDGRPLDTVEVVFLPDPERGNLGNRASAYTDENGRYKLRCPRDKQDGTVLGPHRVCIRDIAAVSDEAGKVVKRSRVPRRYADPAQTPFRAVEVKPAGQTLDFDVKAGGT